MGRRRTRGEAEIDARLSTLEPNSKRYQVLAAAREFKASWVQLGEQLTEVQERAIFRDWGYVSFDTYCRRELRIKSDTAQKLTRSFVFMREEEPQLLQERAPRELPPLDVVDLMSRARERTQVSDDQLDEIRGEVFAPDANLTKNEVVKRFREVDPDAFRPPPRTPKPASETELRKALLLGERLLGLLEGPISISPSSVEAVRGAVGELRERFESKHEASQEAATETPMVVGTRG